MRGAIGAAGVLGHMAFVLLSFAAAWGLAETLKEGDRISPRLQAERQMDRLRQRGIEPKQIAMAAAGLLMGLLFIRHWRHSGDGD